MRKRWYHKVATEIILNTFVVNAQIMYNEQNFQNKLTIRKFREVLVDEFLNLKPTSLRVSNSEQPLENRFLR